MKLFLNILITHTHKKNIESFIQFLLNDAFNNIYCFNYKESLGTTPTPSGKFKLNTVQLSTMTTTLSPLPATKIIVRITIVIDHLSLPTKRISRFLHGILCILMTTRVLL